jgi:transcriptional regulator with XRE-family HTH domain
MPFRLVATTPRPGYPKQVNHLGDQLRAKRIELGLLQREVAQLIGVTALTITNWELGRTNPSVRSLPGIFRFLWRDAD